MTTATISKAEAKRQEQEAAMEELRETFPRGSEVPLILRHVSKSGMLRSISPLDGLDDVSYLVARALDLKTDRDRGGVKVGGCGMDMGFHLVYELAYVLHGDGYALRHRWI